MGTVAFEKVEQTVKVISELVEQGECFFINEKYKEVIAEVRNLESFITEKYLEDAEETNAEVTTVEIEKALQNLIAASENSAAKKIYNNTIQFLKR